MKPILAVETTISAPLETIWQYWNEPDHITHWYFASDDWCAPQAENDLRVGGMLKIRMEACDGSTGFDFEALYTKIEPLKKIEYLLGDRAVKVEFIPHDSACTIIESFEAEDENSLELQQDGWQAILNNFKKYVEQATH